VGEEAQKCCPRQFGGVIKSAVYIQGKSSVTVLREAKKSSPAGEGAKTALLITAIWGGIILRVLAFLVSKKHNIWVLQSF
jgi:hypothetical protein